MQGIMETIFDIMYLCTVITIGILMVSKAKENKEYKLFGIMALVLGIGDAFHLVPRAYALLNTGLINNAVALGVGKLITSITMTIFYVILYSIWKMRYKITKVKWLDFTIYILAVIRVILCAFPQNEWLDYSTPVIWGIYRNIPFAMMGIIILVLFYIQSKKQKDTNYRFMWFAIVLSFGFYVPVVLWAQTYNWVGALMIPKTLAYVWVIFMGFIEFRKLNKK